VFGFFIFFALFLKSYYFSISKIYNQKIRRNTQKSYPQKNKENLPNNNLVRQARFFSI